MTDETPSGYMQLHPHERHLRAVPRLDVPRGMSAIERTRVKAYAEGLEDGHKQAFDASMREKAKEPKPRPFRAAIWFLFGAASSLGLFAVAVLALRAAA